MPELAPRAFSFNSPHGACPECQGLGATWDFDPARIVPDPAKTLAGGAIAPWASGDKSSSPSRWKRCRGRSASISTRRSQAAEEASGRAAVRAVRRDRRAARKTAPRPAHGKRPESTPRPIRSARTSRALIPNLRRRYDEATWSAQEEMEPYRALRTCPACQGDRLQAGEPCRPCQGPSHRRVRRSADRRCAARIRSARAHRPRIDHRRPHPEGDSGSSPVSQRRRRWLSHARPERRDAVRRRRPADPPGHADRLEPHRRALRARRAIDRPASARQPARCSPRLAASRPRQHRALSSSTTRRRSARPTTSSISGRAPGEHGGEVIFQGTPAQLLGAGRIEGGTRAAASLTGAYLRGERRIETPPRAAAPDCKGELVDPRRAREQPEEHRRRDSRSGVHRRSPASAARANPRSSTRFSTSRWRGSSTARRMNRASTTASTASRSSTR